MAKANKRSSKGSSGPTASGGKGGRAGNTGARSGEGGPHSVSDPTPTGEPKKGLHGVPGSKDDSRRCTANKVNTGERCKAPAIKGGVVCRVHGGAAKQVKKAAKERLLELVDPALAALHKVLSRPDVDDAVKVRAALGILDRTGFRQGVDLNVTVSEWDKGITEAVLLERDLDDDPALGDGGGEQPALESSAFLDAEAAVEEADAEWAEQAREDKRSRIKQGGHDVVRGEVVDDYPFPTPEYKRPPRNGATEHDASHYPGPYDAPPPREPDAPPRYVDWEAREADRKRGEYGTRWG
jgi:hypothetical protein